MKCMKECVWAGCCQVCSNTGMSKSASPGSNQPSFPTYRYHWGGGCVLQDRNPGWIMRLSTGWYMNICLPHFKAPGKFLIYQSVNWSACLFKKINNHIRGNYWNKDIYLSTSSDRKKPQTAFYSSYSICPLKSCFVSFLLGFCIKFAEKI